MWYALARFFAWWVIRVFCRSSITGHENMPQSGGVLLISNHQSYLDSLAVAFRLKRQVVFMARDTLFRNKVFGGLIRRLGAFPVKRDSADRGAVKEALSQLAEGRILCIFPEGTRTRDGRLAELKSGFSMIARRGAVPIMPVYIDGTFNAWSRTRKFPRPAKVKVRFGELIPVKEIQSLTARALEKLVTERLLALEEVGRIVATRE